MVVIYVLIMVLRFF